MKWLPLLVVLPGLAGPAAAESHSGGVGYAMLPAGFALCTALGLAPDEACDTNIMIERGASQPDKRLRMVAYAPANAGDPPRPDCARSIPIMADRSGRKLILACFEP